MLLKKLKEDIDILKSAINTLQYSYDKCRKIGVKTDYSLEELESFESLTSRFARLSDIMTQKIFKTIIELSLEDIYTFIDRLNYMEKLEIYLFMLLKRYLKAYKNTNMFYMKVNHEFHSLSHHDESGSGHIHKFYFLIKFYKILSAFCIQI